MNLLFNINDFSGGLDAQIDAAKLNGSSYPLLINGRTRRNTVTPAGGHTKIEVVEGLKQGLYIAGEYALIFIAGVAYYADVKESTLNFRLLPSWNSLSPTVNRVYAELVPATSNFLTSSGVTGSKSFDGTVANFSQALFVFDGVNIPAAIFPDGTNKRLGTYEDWSRTNREYVPIGVLPTMLNNKLFLISPDRQRIFSSVSGRASDFVINSDNQGDKVGDAETVATAVSYNAMTGMRPLSSGQMLVTTLYGCYALDLDYDNTVFGEPYLNPVDLFPVGCINELSIVPVNNDTAFITQSGIHSFNAVAMKLSESNLNPFGAKISELLVNPQADTCAVIFNDYALFAVNTIYGYGVLVYDTTRQVYVSLDLSFGRVKQFAVAKYAGRERLFYITHDNELYEAFSGQTNNARLYLGEFTLDGVDKTSLIHNIRLMFSDVVSSGHVKISLYSDRKLINSVVLPVTADYYVANTPIPIPFSASSQVQRITWELDDAVLAWKIGMLIEWNFSGALTDAGAYGNAEVTTNPEMRITQNENPEVFAFIADSGPSTNTLVGAVFLPGNVFSAPVVRGDRYCYDANGDGLLLTGKLELTSGIFKAPGDRVSIQGTAGQGVAALLRNGENFYKLLDLIHAEPNLQAIIGGGDHCYDSGTPAEVTTGLLGIKYNFWPVAGNHDIDTNEGKWFYNQVGIPRYYKKSFGYADFFFYNGGYKTANVAVDADGYPGISSELDGVLADSIQGRWLRNELAVSTALYKIVVVHFPPYTTGTYYPGYAPLRLPFAAWGASAVMSGHSHVMERFIYNRIPYFVCGAGGRNMTTFTAGVTHAGLAFRSNANFGYIRITSDPLTCKFEFVDIHNKVLDTYAVYA